MIEPVLVVLAAGLGSRYGGLKQIDIVGDRGECLMDFSIFDAHLAGFKKVVLIINRSHEAEFEEVIGKRLRLKMLVEYCYQNEHDLPSGFVLPEGRVKPWGTVQALLSIKNKVKGPFAVINADDYYGRESFKLMYDFLSKEVSFNHYSLIGYKLGNTVTSNGTVTRALCKTTDSYLTEIIETKNIGVYPEGIFSGEAPKLIKHDDSSLVSMNFWGFSLELLGYLESIFEDFLSELTDPLKDELVISTAISQLIADAKVQVKMMETNENWFGVTYKEDKKTVMQELRQLKETNFYPKDLWTI